MNFVLMIVIVVLIVGFVLALYFMHVSYEKQLKKEVKRAQKSEQLKSAFIDNVCHTLRTEDRCQLLVPLQDARQAYGYVIF